MVLVEFWLACYLGRAWLLARRFLHLRPVNDGLPEVCSQVARRDQLPAGVLFTAQDFAARVWSRAAMAALLLAFPVGFALGISAQLRWGMAETALSWLFYAIGTAMIVALAQMGLIRYRSNQNRRWWTREKSSPEQPLPEGSDGLPKRSDFWLAALLAVAAFLILLYASTRSPHH
ncbi:MAG: hypothetical protein J2P27_06020 [Actinobacteria bacterium]|nr:hypothetical protein [Actinomycetota bacterium]